MRDHGRVVAGILEAHEPQIDALLGCPGLETSPQQPVGGRTTRHREQLDRLRGVQTTHPVDELLDGVGLVEVVVADSSPYPVVVNQEGGF